MTDTEKKIAEIREALEKATPGPWAVFVGEGWTEEYPRNTYVQAVWNEPDHRGSIGYRVARMAGVHGRTMADAHLIANAPEWLRFLLEERAKLIKGLRSIRKELDRLSRESRQKWKREGDMYEQGRADAYDEADVLIRDILKECGVTVD